MGYQTFHRAAATASLILSAVILPASAGAQVFVRGVLYDDASGHAVRGTVMLVDPANDGPVTHVVSDSLGRFELKAREGVYQIAAVLSGYTSVLSAPVTLANGERMTIRVPIAQTGDPQHQISVVEHLRPAPAAAKQRADAEDGGFARRRAVGNGLSYDRAQLAQAHVTTLGEFLQTVPGFQVTDPSSTRSMQLTRNAGMFGGGSLGPLSSACHIGWFVDGHRMDLPGQIDPTTDGLGTFQMEAIEALEIFRGLSEMPAQFAEPDLRCGAVAIWTRKH